MFHRKLALTDCLVAQVLSLTRQVGLPAGVRLTDRTFLNPLDALHVLGELLFDLLGALVKQLADRIVRRSHLVLDVLLEGALNPVIDRYLLLDIIDGLALAFDHLWNFVWITLEHLQPLHGAIQLFL